MDASLKELTSLVREVNPDARRKGTFFDFSVVYANMGGPGNRFQRGPGGGNELCHYSMREIGTTVSGRKGVDDSKTLAQSRFCIGDYIDIAITPPDSPSGRLDR